MKLAIGLGASLGPREHRLELTLRQLHAAPGLKLLRTSRWVRTPPLKGGTARGWFLNVVGLYQCERDLDEVLQLCRALESQAGRRRAKYWGDRTLDVDLLVAEGVHRTTPHLLLPHPAIASRPFVLEPLLEVWPDVEDPSTGRPYRELPQAPGPRPQIIGLPQLPRSGT